MFHSGPLILTFSFFLIILLTFTVPLPSGYCFYLAYTLTENMQDIVMLIIFMGSGCVATASHSHSWLSMVNQAHIKHKGLEIGLQSGLGLVPACHGRPSVFRGWVCGVFPLPYDSHGGRGSSRLFSFLVWSCLSVNDRRLMSPAEVRLSANGKHDVQLSVERLPVTLEQTPATTHHPAD